MQTRSKFFLLLIPLLLCPVRTHGMGGGGNGHSAASAARNKAQQAAEAEAKLPPASLEDLEKYSYDIDCWGEVHTRRTPWNEKTRTQMHTTIEKLSAASKEKLMALAKILPLYDKTRFDQLLMSGGDDAIDEAYRLWVKFEFYASPTQKDAHALEIQRKKNINLARQASELLEKGYPIDADRLMSIFDGISKKLSGTSIREDWTKKGLLEAMEIRAKSAQDPITYLKEEMPGVLTAQGYEGSFISKDASCYMGTVSRWVPFKHKVGLARALMEEALGLEAPKPCTNGGTALQDFLEQSSKILSDCFTGLFCFKGSPEEKRASQSAALEAPEAMEPGIPLNKQKQPVRFSEPLREYLSLRLKELTVAKQAAEKEEFLALRLAEAKNPKAKRVPGEIHACIDKQRDEIESLMAGIYKQRITDGGDVRRIGAAEQAFDKIKHEGQKYRVESDAERWNYDPKKNPNDPCLGRNIPLEQCKEEVIKNYLSGAEPHELRAYERELGHAAKALGTEIRGLENNAYTSPFDTAKVSTDLKNKKRACTFEEILRLNPKDWTLKEEENLTEGQKFFRAGLSPIRQPLSVWPQQLSNEELIDLSYVLWHNPPPEKELTSAQIEALSTLIERKQVPVTAELKAAARRMEYDALVQRVGGELKTRLADGSGPSYVSFLPLVKEADDCVTQWRDVKGKKYLRPNSRGFFEETDRLPLTTQNGCSPGVINWNALKAQKTDIKAYNDLDRVVHSMLGDLNLPTGAKFTDSETWYRWAQNAGSYHVHHEHLPNCAAEGLFNDLMNHHEAALGKMERTKPTTVFSPPEKGLLGQLMEESAASNGDRARELKEKKEKLEDLKHVAQWEISLRKRDNPDASAKRDLADQNASDLRAHASDKKYEGDQEEVGAALRFPPHLLALWRYYREAIRQAESWEKNHPGKEAILKAAREQLQKVEQLPSAQLVDEWQWYERQALDGGEVTDPRSIVDKKKISSGSRNGAGSYVVDIRMMQPFGLGRGEKWGDDKTQGKDPKWAFSVQDARFSHLLTKGNQRLDAYTDAVKARQGGVAGAEKKEADGSKTVPTKIPDPFTPYIKSVMEATPAKAEEKNQTPFDLTLENFDVQGEPYWVALGKRRKELLSLLSKAIKGEEVMGYHFNPKDPKHTRLINALVNSIRSIDMAQATKQEEKDKSVPQHLTALFGSGESASDKLSEYKNLLQAEITLSEPRTTKAAQTHGGDSNLSSARRQNSLTDALREVADPDYTVLRSPKLEDKEALYAPVMIDNLNLSLGGSLTAESRVKIANLSPYARKMLSAWKSLGFSGTIPKLKCPASAKASSGGPGYISDTENTPFTHASQETLRNLFLDPSPEKLIDMTYKNPYMLQWYLGMLSEQMDPEIFSSSGINKAQFFQDLCVLTARDFEKNSVLRASLTEKLKSLVTSREGEKITFKNEEAARMLAFFLQSLDEIGLQKAGPASIQAMGGGRRFEPAVVLARMEREEQMLAAVTKEAETDPKAKDRLTALKNTEAFMNKQGMSLPALSKILILSDAEKLAGRAPTQSHILGIPEAAIEGLTHEDLQMLNRLTEHMTAIKGRDVAKTRKELQPVFLTPTTDILTRVGMKIAPEVQGEILSQRKEKQVVDPIRESLSKSGVVDGAMKEAVAEAIDPHYDQLQTLKDNLKIPGPFPPGTWYEVLNLLNGVSRDKTPEGMDKKTKAELLRLKAKAVSELDKNNNYVGLGRLAEAEFQKRYSAEITEAGENPAELQRLKDTHMGSIVRELERRYRLDEAVKLFDAELKRLAEIKGKPEHYPPKGWKEVEELLRPEKINGVEQGFKGNSQLWDLLKGIDHNADGEGLKGQETLIGALASRYLTEKSVKGELSNFLAGGPMPECLRTGLTAHGPPDGQNAEADLRQMLLSSSDPSKDPRPRYNERDDSIATQDLDRKTKVFIRRVEIASREYLRVDSELSSELNHINAEVQLLAKIPNQELYSEQRKTRVQELDKRREEIRRDLNRNKEKLLALKKEYDTRKPEFEKTLGEDRARNIQDVFNNTDRKDIAWQNRYEGVITAYSKHCLEPKLNPGTEQTYDYSKALNEGEGFKWDESIQRAAMEEFNETQDLLVRGRELAKGIPLPNTQFATGTENKTPPAVAEYYLKNHPNRSVISHWLGEARARGIDQKLALNLMDQWLRDGENHQKAVDEKVNSAIAQVESRTVTDPLTGKKVNAGISWTGSGWKVENATLLRGLKYDEPLMKAFDALAKIHPGAQNPIKEVEDRIADSHIGQGLPDNFYVDDHTVGVAYKNETSETGYSYDMKPMEGVQKQINDQLAKIRQLQYEFINEHERMKASADAFLPIPMFTALEDATHKASSILKYKLAKEIKKLREFGNVPIKDDPQGHQFDQLTANEAADNFALQLGQFQADHLKVLKDVDDRWSARYREELAWLAVELAAAAVTFGASEGALAASRGLRIALSVATKLRSAARLHKAGILLGQATQFGESQLLDLYYSQNAEEYEKMVREGKTGTKLSWSIADKNADGIYDKYQNGGYIPFQAGNPIEEEKALYKSFAVFGGAGVLDKIGWLDPLIKSETLRGAVAFGLSGATNEMIQGNGIEAAVKHGLRGTLYGLSLPKIGQMVSPKLGAALERSGALAQTAGNMAYLSSIDASFFTLDYALLHPEMREHGSYTEGLYQDLKGGVLMNYWFSRGVPKEVEHIKMEREFKAMLNEAGKPGSNDRSLKAVEARWVKERLNEQASKQKKALSDEERLVLQESLKANFRQFISSLSVSEGEALLKDLAKHNSTPGEIHENEKYLGELLRVPSRYAGAALEATKGGFRNNYGSMREYAHGIRQNAAKEIAKDYEKGERGNAAEKTNAKQQLLKDVEVMGLEAFNHLDMDKLARTLNLEQSVDRQLYLLLSSRMGVRTAKLDGSVSPLEQSNFVKFSRYYQGDKAITPKTRELLYSGAANNPEVLGSQIHNGSLKPREAEMIFGREKVEAALRLNAVTPSRQPSPARRKEIEAYQQGLKDADAVTKFHKNTNWKKLKSVQKEWTKLTSHLNEVLTKRPASLFQMPVNVVDISPETTKAIMRSLAEQTGRSEESLLQNIFLHRVVGSESQTIAEVLAGLDREPAQTAK